MKAPFPAIIIETTPGAIPTCRVSPCTVLEIKPAVSRALVKIPTPGSLFAVEKWVEFAQLASTREAAIAKTTEAIADVICTLPAISPAASENAAADNSALAGAGCAAGTPSR